MKSIKFNLRHLVTVCLFLSASMLFSCQKDDSISNEPVSDEEAVTVSEENAAADAEFEETAEIGLSVGADMEAAVSVGHTNFGSGIHANAELFAQLASRLGSCANITVAPNDSTYPKTVTIDYGVGCICRDGKFRKGKIVLHYTKPIRRPGAVLTINLEGYFVNRAHIEGTKVITNETQGGVHKYAVVVTNGRITWPNGRGFTYEKVKTVTQVSGMATATISDDVHSIEGRSKTVYANGITVNKNTETPLIKPVSCSWIAKGMLKIKINNRELFLDFGADGNCDNKAQLSWNGHLKDITLP